MPNVAVTVDGLTYRKDRRSGARRPQPPRLRVNGVPVEIGGVPEARTTCRPVATPRT